MNEKNTGGPAFPMLGRVVNGEWKPHSQFTGLTVRDYFASKAMRWVLDNGYHDSEHRVADECYELADAMLKRREM